MDAEKRETVQVVLSMSEEEARLLKRLMNGLSVDEITGVVHSDGPVDDSMGSHALIDSIFGALCRVAK